MAKSSARFELDHVGMEEILKSAGMTAMVNETTEKLAANLRGLLPDGVDVDVVGYSTDRGAASVAIAHPSGRARQLREGSLTRAAGMMGLTVRSS